MDLVNLHMRIKIIMKENEKIIKLMGKENINYAMEVFMRVNERMIFKKALVLKYGRMVKNFMGIILMDKKMVRAFIYEMMDQNMRANEKIIQ